MYTKKYQKAKASMVMEVPKIVLGIEQSYIHSLQSAAPGGLVIPAS
jgi:hypothetical protein